MSNELAYPVCARCGAPRPAGRTRYCGDECWSLAQSERTRARQQRRMAACKRCGGPKELGTRGGKYCDECRRVIADRGAHHEHEKRRREKVRRATAELAEGDVLRQPVWVDGKRKCARCQDYFPETSFPGRAGKKTSYCIPCQRAYNSERRMRLQFGLSWDEYDFLLASQDYRCAICGGRPRKYNLAVDHDHNTGEIRGLLCSKCNHRLLGSANDDPARLRKAADYLEEFGPREVFGERRYVPGFGREAG